MLKILYKLNEQKSLVSIYTRIDDTSRFHFGYILAINESEFAFQMISPDGEDDGIVTMDVNSIFKVEEKDQYSEKMEKLCSCKDISLYELDVKENDIKKAVLMFAMKNKHIISIELLNSGRYDTVGFIESIDDSECKIKQVDEYGYTDGFSYIALEDITEAMLLSEDEKRIEKLWKINQK